MVVLKIVLITFFFKGKMYLFLKTILPKTAENSKFLLRICFSAVSSIK